MRTTHKPGDMTATRERRPKSGVENVDRAAVVLAYLSRHAGGRATEPGSAKVSLQRRTQLLARAQQTAADIKARP